MFEGWLKNDIRMSSEDQNNFYAVTFLPWVAKPLYGVLSDNCPIFGLHRVRPSSLTF